jgi:hypothetical protein
MARMPEISVDEALAYFAVLGSWAKVARVMQRPSGQRFWPESIRLAVIRKKGRDAPRVRPQSKTNILTNVDKPLVEFN